MPKLGAFAKEIVLARPDKRSRESRLLQQMRQSLTRQLGDKAKAPAMQALIEGAAMQQLIVSQIEADIIAGKSTDIKEYRELRRDLYKVLREIGLEPPPPPQKTLEQHLAALASRGSAGAA